MITKIKRVILISLQPQHSQQYDIQFQKLSDDLFDLTRGLYRYEVVHRWDINAPLSNAGLMMEFDIEDWIASYKADEVWVFGSQTSETAMGGQKAFWLGALPVSGTDRIPRRFVFMRFGDNISPLKSYAQRIECTLYKLYEGYPPAKNMWDKYMRECGTVLRPANSILEGYSHSLEYLSNHEDWEQYPNFRHRCRFISSSEWGGTQDGYLRWWMKYLPHGTHKTDGIHDNWWHYVMNVDRIK